MTDFDNEARYGECVVSCLAMPEPEHRSNGAVAGAIGVSPDIFRYFTGPEGGAAAGGPGETGIVVRRGPGTGDIVRARPIGAQAGSVALARELIDLLHIQLQCLAKNILLQGAVVADVLRVGADLEDPCSGPALSRARDMAGSGAALPCIAVGEEVFRRLGSGGPPCAEGRVPRHEMDLIDCMTATDGGGLRHIDYLGGSLGDFDYDFARYVDFLGHHKRFVETGLSAAPRPGNAERFHWLKKYHNARVEDDILRSGAGTFAGECGRAMVRTLTPLRIS